MLKTNSYPKNMKKERKERKKRGLSNPRKLHYFRYNITHTHLENQCWDVMTGTLSCSSIRNVIDLITVHGIVISISIFHAKITPNIYHKLWIQITVCMLVNLLHNSIEVWLQYIIVWTNLNLTRKEINFSMVLAMTWSIPRIWLLWADMSSNIKWESNPKTYKGRFINIM